MHKSGSRSPKKNGGEKEREKGERTEKFSRSTIACNGCRMRKQKCGGEKPVCLRCRTLNKPCVWPEQLKRGPSKGYNESLELRLRETESVLMALLSMASDAQLSNLSELNIPEGDVTPSAAEKKQKLEEWVSFPLRSRDDIVRWRDDRMGREGSYGTATETGSASVEPMMEIRQEGSRMADGEMEIDQADMDVGMNQRMENMDGVGMQNLGPLNSIDHIQAAAFENYLPSVQESGQSSASTIRSPSAGHGRGGLLGLSKEFQDTFLW